MGIMTILIGMAKRQHLECGWSRYLGEGLRQQLGVGPPLSVGYAANAVLQFVELNTRKLPIRSTQRAGNRQVLRRKLGPVCSVKDG